MTNFPWTNAVRLTSAFFFKKVGGKAVFISAIAAEIWVITVFIMDKMEILNIAYLWLNLVGCILVVVFSLITQNFIKKKSPNLS